MLWQRRERYHVGVGCWMYYNRSISGLFHYCFVDRSKWWFTQQADSTSSVVFRKFHLYLLGLIFDLLMRGSERTK